MKILNNLVAAVLSLGMGLNVAAEERQQPILDNSNSQAVESNEPEILPLIGRLAAKIESSYDQKNETNNCGRPGFSGTAYTKKIKIDKNNYTFTYCDEYSNGPSNGDTLQIEGTNLSATDNGLDGFVINLEEGRGFNNFSWIDSFRSDTVDYKSLCGGCEGKTWEEFRLLSINAQTQYLDLIRSAYEPLGMDISD